MTPEQQAREDVCLFRGVTKVNTNDPLYQERLMFAEGRLRKGECVLVYHEGKLIDAVPVIEGRYHLAEDESVDRVNWYKALRTLREGLQIEVDNPVWLFFLKGPVIRWFGILSEGRVYNEEDLAELIERCKASPWRHHLPEKYRENQESNACSKSANA
jgi:hypothetical protein